MKQTNLLNAAPILNIPEYIKSLHGWLCWKYEHDLRGGKPRKVPYYAANKSRRKGEQGGAEDRAQLATFDAALSALAGGGFDGVGLALLPEFGVVALDFDNCVKDGVVAPAVERIVACTYSEYSPSGNGIRAFMLGNLGNDKDAHGEQFGFEVFSTKGFVTVTGQTLEACRILGNEKVLANITPLVQELYTERFGQKNTAPSSEDFTRNAALRNVDAETIADLRDAVCNGLAVRRANEYSEWINVGLALKSLDRSIYADDARAIWLDFSLRGEDYDEYQASLKWDGFAPGKITHRSIFDWAQQDGWKNPRGGDVLKSGDPEQYSNYVDRTDTGNANLLAQLTGGDLRFVPERGLWLWWDGSRWLADEHKNEAHKAAQLVGQHYHREAADLKGLAGRPGLSDEDRKRLTAAASSVEKWAATCRNKRPIDSMLALASHTPSLTVKGEDMDCDPWLFGAQNGVIDLRTGSLRPAARDEFVTKRSPIEFDPNAGAPRWEKFIDEITGEPLPVEYDDAGCLISETVGRYKARPGLAAYIQRNLGYCLTGLTVEQKMFIYVGAGSNGKNVLLDMVQKVTGDYCRTLSPAFLMAAQHEGGAEQPSSTAAGLAGGRLAISSESKNRQRLDVGLVKLHTGGGYMTARLMRENTFRFLITHKLILMTNHPPTLDHLDDAMRGRLHLIPFDRVWNRPGHTERDEALPDGDKDLMAQLMSEQAGILAWLVRGAVDYSRDGLTPPAEVARMTRDYFAEQDPVSRWLDTLDRCAPKQGDGAAALFTSYTQWANNIDTGGGQGPQSEKAFAQALASRGVQKIATKTGKKYGIRAKKVTGDGW